jgi:hypothetical protein
MDKIMVRSFDDLKTQMRDNPVLQKAVLADPKTVLDNVVWNPKTDKTLYYLIIGILGAVVLGVLADLIFSNGNSNSQAIITLGSTSLGGLVGIVVPSPTQAGKNN